MALEDPIRMTDDPLTFPLVIGWSSLLVWWKFLSIKE